jgi:hypothetical protein
VSVMSDEKTGVSDEKTGVSDESIDVSHVFPAGDRAKRSISTARSKNEGDLTPPPPTNIADFSS